MMLLTRRGDLVEEQGATYMAGGDADSDDTRTLRPLQAAACTYRIAFGPRAGQKRTHRNHRRPRAATGVTPSCLAAAAKPPVGTASLELNDQALGRKAISELWFEATPGSVTQDFAVRPPLRAITIARDAAPAAGAAKRPLIVISHGNWGTRFSQGWLALRLASYQPA